MGHDPRATIIIPAGPNAVTIDLAIESALNQRIDDLEIIVVGDGCDDVTRTLIDPYWRTDSRVRFMDLPASRDGGEEYRRAAVAASQAPVVAYLASDALLCPDHIGDVSKALEDAAVVSSVPGWFTPDGSFTPMPATSSERALAAHGTGIGHRSDWDMPAGDGKAEAVRVASTGRVTTISLPVTRDGRGEWSTTERRGEAERWMFTLRQPDARATIDAAVVFGLAEWMTATAQRSGASAEAPSSFRWRRWFRRS